VNPGRVFRLWTRARSVLLLEFLRDNPCERLQKGNKSSTSCIGAFVGHGPNRLLLAT
jgi:hypothetical protein